MSDGKIHQMPMTPGDSMHFPDHNNQQPTTNHQPPPLFTSAPCNLAESSVRSAWTKQKMKTKASDGRGAPKYGARGSVKPRVQQVPVFHSGYNLFYLSGGEMCLPFSSWQIFPNWIHILSVTWVVQPPNEYKWMSCIYPPNRMQLVANNRDFRSYSWWWLIVGGRLDPSHIEKTRLFQLLLEPPLFEFMLVRITCHSIC